MIKSHMDWIKEFYSMMIELVQENGTLFVLLGAGSLVLFAGTILAIPLLVVSIPRDYFLHERAAVFGFGARHPLVRLLFLIVKEAVGAVCVAAGFIMLFMPGQGLLTIFIGVLLLNFPGKRKLELRLVRHPQIKKGINWIRRRAGKEPLRLPPEFEP
ncbi:MAG: PGPGW domain-containing protein [Spirochaetota bacterium]